MDKNLIPEGVLFIDKEEENHKNSVLRTETV
jgi:hypothetical protein